ncbi:MAG: type VI secretion system tip protein TssI/VgrG [Amphritea sp.]
MGVFMEPQSSNLVAMNSNGDSFVVTRLSHVDALSELPLIEADVVCRDTDAQSWLGETLSCELYSGPGASRTAMRSFQGVVTGVQIRTVEEDSRFINCRLRMQPWLALLGYSRNYRVFQEKTTQDIVTSIFDELGFKGQYKIDSMPTTTREYCLQFNETDLAFVLRLLSEEGVHFHFGRDTESNILILHDAAKPFSDEGKSTLDDSSTPSGDNATIEEWTPRYSFQASSLELANYDYNQTKQVSSSSTASKFTISANSKLKDFRYPVPSISGQMDDFAKPLADSRRAQMDSGYQLIDGQTHTSELGVGSYLELANHQDSGQQGEYLLTAVHYEFIAKGEGQLTQVCRFTCVPQEHSFYPPLLEKPRVYGMQSAVVAGKTDAEPASDEQGRIRIRFHWDTKAEGDKTSCAVRVAQSMAGNGYGLQFIPRAGQEVLVSFLDGDPDQPLVTGSVFNSKHKPPYPTVDTTQSGIKTQLQAKSNELRFDDKKDNEQLYLHAAKDMLVEVENDADEKVTAEKRVTVTKDITVKGEQNYNLETKQDISLKTENNYALSATEAITVEGKTIKLEATDTLELIVGGSKLVMSDSKIEIHSDTISLTGSSKIELDGGKIAIAGDSKIEAKSGGSMSLEASSSFAASGMNAELKATSAVTVEGSGTAEVSSSGQTTVKGSMVMIN